MSHFRCPCQTCPNCGAYQARDQHPEDGLAYCHECAHPESVIEWWCVVGPPEDATQHIRSDEELQAGRDYDNAILQESGL